VAVEVLAAIAVLAVACGPAGGPTAGGQHPAAPASAPPQPQVTTTPAPAARTFSLPSQNGLNYGGPSGPDGQWLGSQWLQPGDGGWALAKPGLQADLDFIASHRLGRVQRLFVDVDQLMVWDSRSGFVRFDDAALANLGEALDMFDQHHLTVIAVVFDQEEQGSPGNFRFQALDGAHPAMRAGYLRAVDQLFRRFGGRATVAGWDLFNEAYNSLGREGGLRPPPAHDPVSPNYPDETVHQWLQDLYQTAKRAAPGAWLTVSDTTELYWRDTPNTSLYDGAVDFYDLHVYDDNPAPKDWQGTLHKPYLLGEVGGDYDHGFKDPAVNARVVGFWLGHARQLGISAVLAHASDDAVYSLASGTLTPTGRVVQAAS
jgi:hypothetical protein